MWLALNFPMRDLWGIWNPTTEKWVEYNVEAIAVFSTRSYAKSYINNACWLKNMKCRPVRLVPR